MTIPQIRNLSTQLYKIGHDYTCINNQLWNYVHVKNNTKKKKVPCN